jgi:hypothetical protein
VRHEMMYHQPFFLLATQLWHQHMMDRKIAATIHCHSQSSPSKTPSSQSLQVAHRYTNIWLAPVITSPISRPTPRPQFVLAQQEKIPASSLVQSHGCCVSLTNPPRLHPKSAKGGYNKMLTTMLLFLAGYAKSKHAFMIKMQCCKVNTEHKPLTGPL